MLTSNNNILPCLLKPYSLEAALLVEVLVDLLVDSIPVESLAASDILVEEAAVSLAEVLVDLLAEAPVGSLAASAAADILAG